MFSQAELDELLVAVTVRRARLKEHLEQTKEGDYSPECVLSIIEACQKADTLLASAYKKIKGGRVEVV